MAILLQQYPYEHLRPNKQIKINLKKCLAENFKIQKWLLSTKVFERNNSHALDNTENSQHKNCLFLRPVVNVGITQLQSSVSSASTTCPTVKCRPSDRHRRVSGAAQAAMLISKGRCGCEWTPFTWPRRHWPAPSSAWRMCGAPVCTSRRWTSCVTFGRTRWTLGRTWPRSSLRQTGKQVLKYRARVVNPS